MSQAAPAGQLPNSARTLGLTTVLLVGIVLLALGLRLYCLDCWGLWYDEVTSIEIAQGGPEAISNTRFGWPGNQPPAYFLVMWVFSLLGEPTQTTLFVRLPSLLTGVLSVPLLYLLGRDTLGRGTGLLSAILLALSLPALTYSQDARQYSVTLFLTLAAFYSLVRIRLGGDGKWWVVFGGAMAANVLYSFLALTLVSPVMALLAAWVLVERWKRRKEMHFSWVPPLISAAAVGVAVAVSGFQPSSITGMPVNPGEMPLSAYIVVLLRDWSWLLRFGLPAQTGIQVALFMLLLAIVGVVVGVRTGGTARTVCLYSAFLIVVAHIELALLSSSRVMLSRYSLFMLPQALLLVAYGTLSLARLVSAVPAKRWSSLPVTSQAVAAALIVGLFVAGAVKFYDPHTFIAENSRTNLKAAAAFLSEEARPGDLIAIVSDPTHATTMLEYYWKGSPPAPAFDALDPLLFEQRPPERLLVVIGGVVNTELGEYFREQQASMLFTYGTSTGVLAVDGNGRPVQELMRAWLEPFAKAIPPGRLPLALEGSLHQAAGDVGRAAESYVSAREPNATLPLWREQIATYEGFAAAGKTHRAWRELLMAKMEDSGEPEVHRQMARALEIMGYGEVAKQEEAVAAALDAMAGTSAND